MLARFGSKFKDFFALRPLVATLTLYCCAILPFLGMHAFAAFFGDGHLRAPITFLTIFFVIVIEFVLMGLICMWRYRPVEEDISRIFYRIFATFLSIILCAIALFSLFQVSWRGPDVFTVFATIILPPTLYFLLYFIFYLVNKLSCSKLHPTVWLLFTFFGFLASLVTIFFFTHTSFEILMTILILNSCFSLILGVTAIKSSFRKDFLENIKFAKWFRFLVIGTTLIFIVLSALPALMLYAYGSSVGP